MDTAQAEERIQPIHSSSNASRQEHVGQPPAGCFGARHRCCLRLLWSRHGQDRPITLAKLSRKLGDLTGLGRSKAGAEKGLVCLYAQQINGSQRLMASRIANGGIQGLAQVELPAGVRVEQAGSQAQVDYAMQQLIAKLSDEDRQAVRSL